MSNLAGMPRALLSLGARWGRDSALLMRRLWKARTTQNGAIVFSPKISAQPEFCSISSSKGFSAAYFFVMDSWSQGSKPGTTKTLMYGRRNRRNHERTCRRGYRACCRFLQYAWPRPCRFDVLPNSVGTLVTNLTGREQLLKWQWILEHL